MPRGESRERSLARVKKGGLLYRGRLPFGVAKGTPLRLTGEPSFFQKITFMSERRVVITGIGVVSPVGSDLQTFWKNLSEGRSGITRYENFEPVGQECLIAGEVKDFDPVKWFKNPKDARRADRFAQMAMAGARLALDDAGLIPRRPTGIASASSSAAVSAGFRAWRTRPGSSSRKGP